MGAMGIVSNQEFESQLNNVTNSPKRTPFVPPIPNPQRDPQKDIQRDFQKDPVTEGEVITGEVVDMVKRGRKPGDNNVPNSLRKLIAGTAHIEGREAALALARDFGISDSSVSAYTKGATSTTSYHDQKPDIIQFIQKRRGRVTKKALRVMTTSLDLLTPEKLATAKAKDLAGVAKDMSSIIGNMSETIEENNIHNGPTLVLYAPQIQEENKFNVIPSSD